LLFFEKELNVGMELFGLAYVGLIWVCLLAQMFIELVKG